MLEYFGVRHLSPAAACQVRLELERTKPDVVLIEGPSDLNGQMEWLCHRDTRLPAAILAYTKQAPVQTILYPFAEYSPEYQAILWAYEHKVPCRFMDLPSDVFLALYEWSETGVGQEEEIGQEREPAGDETFWERHFEQLTESYAQAAAAFGRKLRQNGEDPPRRRAENQIREAYMKRMILEAQKEGKVFCVCGAYHVSGLQACEPMTAEEEQSLPRVEASATLMPYSYYRLSKRSGYGAGNQAPAYYELLWGSICQRDLEQTAYQYLTRLAAEQRKQGQMTSSAEVIEAARLAKTLAYMRGSRYPVLQDLRDAAVTCIGHGNFAEISISLASVEIGTKIGALPEGVSRTSIQDDFYRQMKELKLEKYRSVQAQQLDLDLRENLKVQSERAAFLDLNRSFFLHRLRVLGVHFGILRQSRQTNANWGEYWSLCWVPETEIELVEAALLGETIELAASFALKEQSDKSKDMSQAAFVFQEAFLCGIPQAASYALTAVQRLAVDTSAIEEVSKTAVNLSNVIRYGDLRKFPPKPLVPLLSQLYLRACLTLEGACRCDDAASWQVMESIERINQVEREHDFLEEEQWISVLRILSERDDLNTKCSGFAMAARIERGLVGEEELAVQVSLRLSAGMPADLAAGWFEGLAKKNRYSLIMRLSLWRQLDRYLEALDEGEFKRALVFLRRAFADFSANEKSDIAENLGEIWGTEPEQAAELLMEPPTEEEQEFLQGLEDFDFGDI